MNKTTIEQATASLAVILLAIVTIGLIIFTADSFFAWDIFPPDIEKFLGFILVAMVITILSSVIVNIMLNLGIIAQTLTELVKRRHDK